MKNRIIALVFAALLCAALCGCGMDRTGNRPGTDTDVLPDVTPLISPDVEDGVVTDQDGIIGNGHGNGADAGDINNAVQSPSPSPDGGKGTAASPTSDPNGRQKP